MRLCRDERGVAIVETAIVLPFVVMLFVGLLDVSRAVWQSETLTTAVREGTRYAIVHGSQSATPSGPGFAGFTAPDRDAAIEQVVRSRAIGLPDLSVSSRWPDGDNARGSRVLVEASAAFTPALSDFFLNGALRVTLRASSTLAIQR